MHSPKSHTFGSVIYEKKTDSYYEEKPYEKIEVVDRIGSGDAYISGFLYGLLKENGNCRDALEYGNAASAMKNTVRWGYVMDRPLRKFNRQSRCIIV
ncbi:MAG: PfkB family carbohydrate kinase [Ruminococcus sp.]